MGGFGGLVTCSERRMGACGGGWRSWEWVSSSVVEPDYIAGAGEKAPAPGCCCVA